MRQWFMVEPRLSAGTPEHSPATIQSKVFDHDPIFSRFGTSICPWNPGTESGDRRDVHQFSE
jgi:hypothetical protein